MASEIPLVVTCNLKNKKETVVIRKSSITMASSSKNPHDINIKSINKLNRNIDKRMTAYKEEW